MSDLTIPEWVGVAGLVVLLVAALVWSVGSLQRESDRLHQTTCALVNAQIDLAVLAATPEQAEFRNDAAMAVLDRLVKDTEECERSG